MIFTGVKKELEVVNIKLNDTDTLPQPILLNPNEAKKY